MDLFETGLDNCDNYEEDDLQLLSYFRIESVNTSERNILLMNDFKDYVQTVINIDMGLIIPKLYKEKVKTIMGLLDLEMKEVFENIFNEDHIDIICRMMYHLVTVERFVKKALIPTSFLSNVYSTESRDCHFFGRKFKQNENERYCENGKLAANFGVYGDGEIYNPFHLKFDDGNKSWNFVRDERCRKRNRIRSQYTDQEKKYNRSLIFIIRDEILGNLLPRLLKYFGRCFLDANFKSVLFHEYFNSSSIVPSVDDEKQSNLFILHLMESFQKLVGAYQIGDLVNRKPKVVNVGIIARKRKRDVEKVDGEWLDGIDPEKLVSLLDEHLLKNNSIQVVNVAAVMGNDGLINGLDDELFDEMELEKHDGTLEKYNSIRVVPKTMTNLRISDSDNGICNGLKSEGQCSAFHALIQVRVPWYALFAYMGLTCYCSGLLSPQDVAS